MKAVILTLVFFVLLTCPRHSSCGQEKITLHYNQRFPYTYEQLDDVVGLTATTAGDAFRSANIPFCWQKTPFKRQLIILAGNSGQDCSCCWFKTSKRQKYAKYTKALYRDNPQVAIAKSNNSKVIDGLKVEDLLKDRSMKMLVKGGYSYGLFLDNLIERCHTEKETVVVENYQMLKMIALGRADYFFVAEEEAFALIHLPRSLRHDFKLVHFSDMPQGLDRYIMCAQQVSDTIIQGLNANLP